jgi:hypothetical protein
VTLTWLVVPVRVDAVGALLVEPIRSWPLVRACDSIIDVAFDIIMRLPLRAVDELVPPSDIGKVPAA